MTDVPPEPPPLDPNVVDSIADHADSLVTWLEGEQVEAASHGHPVDSLDEQISGWRFVAEAMREWSRRDDQ